MQVTSSDASKNTKDVAEMMKENSSVWGGNFMFMIELRKKILTFRDIIDLPACDCSSPIIEVFNYLLKQYASTRKVIHLKLSFISLSCFPSSGSC